MKDKKTIAIIILSLLLIAVALFFAYNYTYSKAYSKGLANGQTALIMEQTQTGKFFYLFNNTVQSTPITQICSDLIKQQGARQ